jgi:hypothetical protein
MNSILSEFYEKYIAYYIIVYLYQQPSKSVVVSDPSPASSSSATQNIQSAKPVELNSEEEKDGYDFFRIFYKFF